ncbi:MAG: hypothetical protein JRG68_07105 [Deltaproteobacteria bacterium]|nr:hypothetical protein [Deltaproteobacteria bacterium]
MIRAFDLQSEMLALDELRNEYQRQGLKRERYLFSLKENGRLKAIIMLNISDSCLNMSDLTNCINVFVLSSDNLSSDAFQSILSEISESMGEDEVPVLLYPAACAENLSISYDKLYNLWVLDMQHTDHYFRCLESILNTRRVNYVPPSISVV